jgi:hypothetical protein
MSARMRLMQRSWSALPILMIYESGELVGEYYWSEMFKNWENAWFKSISGVVD